MSNNKTKTLSIIIPSWNSQKQMQQNLPYVFKAAKVANAEIIVVDDSSSLDQSWEYLLSLGKKVRAYQNKTNLGYGETVNKGVNLAVGEIVILLNTDVRPNHDCFVNALKYFEDPSVFALGFNSNEAWMSGDWRGGLFHHYRANVNKYNHNQLNPSLWASGGQAAFDRTKWLELGGMDALYKPFYWEDTDLGFNAWKRGWQVLWAPDCLCVHDHRKSVIATNYSQEFITRIAQRNQFLFVWKNISDFNLLLSHFLRLPYYLLKYPHSILSAIIKLPQALYSRSIQKKYWVKKDKDIMPLWKH